MPSTRLRLQRIAILNPLPDYGISTYTHEFAEGLAANDIAVDVYAHSMISLQQFDSRNYQLYGVLGGLVKRWATESRPPVARSSSQPARTTTGSAAPTPHQSSIRGRLREWIRIRVITLQLIQHLYRQRYDLIWTQWFSPGVLDLQFWRWCNRLGLRVAHTVHNVLPHEIADGDHDVYANIYRDATFLIVHSAQSRADLIRTFPGLEHKILVMPHGLYSKSFPRNAVAASSFRNRLGISSGTITFLVCGGIRPYKNIDGVLKALAKLKTAFDWSLIVSGRESGFPDASETDALFHTRQLAERLGLSRRIHLLPGFLAAEEMSQLFEAADIVLLPYIKSYGSGLLLLAMSFGRYIVATAEGGAVEYLSSYERSILVEDPSPESVLKGISQGLDAASRRSPEPNVCSDLLWPQIAKRITQQIADCLTTGG